jgi:hypothetical protein
VPSAPLLYPAARAARSGIEAVTVSVQNLSQTNDNACWFGLMCSQLCKVSIPSFSKPYYLAVPSFHPWNLEQLQYMESPSVEKESMVPKQFAELRDCGMILSKHLCSKLRQGSEYLAPAGQEVGPLAGNTAPLRRVRAGGHVR